MKKTKTQKGITLIALIITIVVLLILAVVTINAIQDDGIIAHADNAATKYKEEATKEEDALSKYTEYLADRSGPWVQAGKLVKNINTGLTLKVGDTANYDETNGGTVTVGTNLTWGVIGAKGGKVLLASANFIDSGITVNNIDITNFEIVLNNACDGYDKGEFAVEGSARSIYVDDINRITRYDKSTYTTGNENYAVGDYITIEVGTTGFTWAVEGREGVTGEYTGITPGQMPFTDIEVGKSYKYGPINEYTYDVYSYLSESKVLNFIGPTDGNKPSNWYWLNSNELIYSLNSKDNSNHLMAGGFTYAEGKITPNSLWALNKSFEQTAMFRYIDHVKCVVEIDKGATFTPGTDYDWNLG